MYGVHKDYCIDALKQMTLPFPYNRQYFIRTRFTMLTNRLQGYYNRWEAVVKRYEIQI